ncbi:exo-rhamnogalacturonan lyase family protein [Microbacterium sp. zg.Y909]|uniref:exo-rhamnogalacturonan lyase family protein n=1 Tax=Microbacterium sp. zg.Y909 TaxID=2969413 RepID=UPI00214C3A46|nr:Tat pathway signal sequence domain protein [Microbacterium sp. zg.Y909]MCR2826024.1 Tat pathway signal sequence domain protein [Microbacterium sp. zg.Y909]
MTGSPAVTVPLRWLDEVPPARLPGGSVWGLPLPRGAAASPEALRLRRVGGDAVPAQFWPLATWPDGSLKWAGAALGATDRPEEYEVTVESAPDAGEATAAGPAPAHPVTVHEGDGTVVVGNGVLTLEIEIPGAAGAPDASGAQHVDTLFRRLRRGDVVVAENAHLVSLLQHDLPEDGGHGPRHPFRSRVTSVAVEQRGPVRAVVRIEGAHRAIDGPREWLPFTVRLVVLAGSDRIRVVHTVIWDGEAATDFVAGLGVRAEVPLRAELHDRHVRIAGADGGFFAEAVRGITGLRRDPGADVRAAQIAGRRTPPTTEWNPQVSSRLSVIPAWGDVTLAQLSADGFGIRKRTAPGHAWIDAGAGTRAEGFVSVSDPDGGFGVGVRSFWQSHPGQLDVRGMAGERATVTAWLHAPDAQPMDVRFYHDGLGQDDYASQLDALEITYEDYEPGFGDAHGIARTHELTFFAYAATPPIEHLALDVAHVQQPPLLQPTPHAVHAAGVFGDWAPVDRSTAMRAEIEDSIDFLLSFYLQQIDQRRWYGFWNYGDVMHAYDHDRHVWRYDVGGYAWDNSELSPDLWLWYSYLRTGRADVFRLAEAMTRHTGEVDVYHVGRWKGLGSRHNVQHWGCSAKQLRISSPVYRRFYHYLTADERVGDLLTELRDSDERFLDTDPTRKVRTDAATYRPDRGALAVGLGTDWGALAATWLADWERTGNERSRDRLLGTMADIAAMPRGFLTGEALYDLDAGRFETTRDRISVSHLSAVFGLVEVCSELISLVDVPRFADAWYEYCRLYLATPAEQERAVGAAFTGVHLEQAHSRLAAWAARHADDDELATLAWRAFEGMGEWLVHRRDFALQRIEPPHVLQPVDEVPTVSTNDAAQYGLAAIQNLALIGDRLPRG